MSARTPRQQAVVEILPDALRILPLDADAAAAAADARRRLLERGEDIGMADSLIAGVCLANEGMLLTNNKKHFKRIEGLKLSGHG